MISYRLVPKLILRISLHGYGWRSVFWRGEARGKPWAAASTGRGIGITPETDQDDLVVFRSDQVVPL